MENWYTMHQKGLLIETGFGHVEASKPQQTERCANEKTTSVQDTLDDTLPQAHQLQREISPCARQVKSGIERDTRT